MAQSRLVEVVPLRIEDEAMLARVRSCGAKECWIDLTQGVDVASAKVTVEPVPAPAPSSKPIGRKSMADELQNASNVIKRSKAAVNTLFAEARMGNAVSTADCKSLVDDIVESIDRNADALVSLCRLKRADEYTYMHSDSLKTVQETSSTGDTECTET